MSLSGEMWASEPSTRVSAQQQFTHREREMSLFRGKVEQLRDMRERKVDWAVDVHSARNNVLVFYGHGGVGKSHLSREIERRFVEDGRSTALRVDFSEPSSRDPELYLLTLRAGLAKLSNSFPAFDTALAVYWSLQHPGTSVEKFVRHQSLLGGLPDRVVLADQLGKLISPLVGRSSPTVPGEHQVTAVRWDAVRSSGPVLRLRRDCPFFEACVTEEDLDEMRLRLPLLLAWDLSQVEQRAYNDVAVFLDAFEHITERKGRDRDGALEEAVLRSAFYLSAVTFVVTGRSKLSWGDGGRSAALEFSGPVIWPTLVTDETDQHEVGVFNDDECERYLSTCLLDDADRPLIEQPLRRHIADRSGGVPLYLDIAVNQYVSVLAAGRAPAENDFDAGIPEIVLRLMEDLPDDDTDLLRVASLLGVFDAETLRIALPGTSPSSVQSFLARSFVLDRGGGIFSIHELLRSSVRTQDEHTSSAWSVDEWLAPQERLVQHWAAQFEDRRAELWRDRRVQALAFWQLCGLYATSNVDAEVLADVIMLVQLQGTWSTLDSGRDLPTVLLNERGEALLRVLDGVLTRQVGHLEDTERTLAAALESSRLSPQVARLATYYLAETRDLRSGRPTGLFEKLTQVDDRIGTEAKIGHAHALIRDGNLDRARTIGEAFDEEVEDPELRYRMHELLGHLWWCSGEFDQAAHHFEISRAVGQAEGSALLLALGLRHLALNLCWTQPERAATYLDEAEALNRDLNLPPGIGQCLTARAVTMIGVLPPDEVDAMLTEADLVFTRAGYLDDAVLPVAASVLAAAAIRDTGKAVARRERLISRCRGRRVRVWLATADIWTSQRDHFDDVSWPIGGDRAFQAWQTALAIRESQVTNPPF